MGVNLVKECAWSVTPAGGFMVRRSDNPDQQFLIKPQPDLRPLRDFARDVPRRSDSSQAGFTLSVGRCKEMCDGGFSSFATADAASVAATIVRAGVGTRS
jgi:hypothetical protein